MQQWCWFADAPIRLVFKDPPLSEIVSPVIKELRDDPSPLASFTCTFETSCDLHRSNDATLIHDGPLGAGLSNPGQIFTAPNKEWLVVEGTGSVAVDQLERLASIRITPDANPVAAATVALFAIDAALFATNQQLLHGAGLILPSQTGAILLFAPSGAGKTTTALALALNGFKILTDDALVLRAGGEQPTVWGLPRPMKVHWRTAELLPTLKSVIGSTWNDEGEQVLTRREFSQLGATAPAGIPVPVVAVYLLADRSSGEHRIERASKAEALLAVAADNIGTSQAGVLPRQVQKMEAAAEMLNRVDVARLHVGPDIDTLSPALIAHSEGKISSSKIAASG